MAPTATSGKTAVICVVGLCKKHQTLLVVEPCTHHALGIAVVRSGSEVNIGKHTFVHTRFDAKIKHGLLLTIIYARHPGEITALVVGFDFIHNGGGQVFQSRLGVSHHKLLAVDKYLLHLLTIDFNGPVVVYLCTGKPLYQLFYRRTFGSAEGCRVINKGIFLEHHLLCLGRHHSPFEHDGIGTHNNLSHIQILCMGYLYTLHGGLIAHIRDFQKILSRGRCRDAEESFLIRNGPAHIRAVGLEQLDGGLHHGLLRITIHHCPSDEPVLCIHNDCCQQQYGQ